MGAIEAPQAAETLGLEPIDLAPDVDHVGAERVRREPFDGLVNQRIDRRMHGVFRIRDGERFH
ncbi:MAG: hypothetical protein WCB51_13330, partial [Candidatus Dormiibacterota bacterium]